jgi:hypothetical protein
MIKHIFTIFLVFILFFESLLPKNSLLDQSAKMGELYAHFQVHKKTGSTLRDFLWMHYASNSKHKSQPEHQKLPTIQTQISNYYNIQLTQYNCNFESIPTISSPNAHNFKYKNLYRFDYLNALLNPPKSA